MEPIMRTLSIFGVVCCLLAGSASQARAQERPTPTPSIGPSAAQGSFAREQKNAKAILDVYLSPGVSSLTHKPFETVRSDASSALQKIGSPAMFSLQQRLEESWNDYLIGAKPVDSLAKVEKVAALLGKFGVSFASMGAYPEPDNPQRVVRDKVRDKLIEIAKARNPELARTQTPGEALALSKAREAAIEALGKIHSQKAAYLVMDHSEVLRSIDNTKDLAKRLRNLAEDLKTNFVRPVPKEAEQKQPQWSLKQQMLDLPDSSTIAAILLDARNLQRYFHGRSNRKLLIFFSELEPAGKDKSLRERTELALTELENNLRIAASGYDPAKKEPNASREYMESVKRDAWLKANRNAFDLCEDMEYLYAELINQKWEDEHKQVHDVLAAFQWILEKEDPSQFAIRSSVLKAETRLYAGED